MFVVFVIALIIVGFAVSLVADAIFTPKYASYDDEVVEDIGGDNVLKATLKSCYKLGE